MITLDQQFLGIRLDSDNPNHHLWNNHGTWFLNYTAYPTPFTKQRIRRSLGTKDVTAARARRDRIFQQLLGNPSRTTGGTAKQFAA